MDDAPAFESPVVAIYGTVDNAPLTLHDESSTTKLIVRAAADTPAAAALEVRFGASRRVEGVLICAQRPGEWIVLGPAADATAFVDGLDRSGHVSVIDHSHSRALFRITGRASSSLLEKICSIDWADDMTPDGAVVSASVAEVNCDLSRQDRNGVPSYLVLCDRSFGQYLFDAIIDAGDEFDIGVVV